MFSKWKHGNWKNGPKSHPLSDHLLITAVDVGAFFPIFFCQWIVSISTLEIWCRSKENRLCIKCHAGENKGDDVQWLMYKGLTYKWECWKSLTKPCCSHETTWSQTICKIYIQSFPFLVVRNLVHFRILIKPVSNYNKCETAGNILVGEFAHFPRYLTAVSARLHEMSQLVISHLVCPNWTLALPPLTC